MNLGNYIRVLLPEHDTVVIPGLGAFVSGYKPAQIDEQSGEMKPPSKKVTFEPRIRNNDGLLAGKIAREEDVSLTEAYRKLEHEREEILYRLDKGERVTFENLGDIWYDQNNEIQFTSSGKDILLLDAYGMESGPLKEEPKKEPEKVTPVEETTKSKKNKDPFKEEAPVVYAGASLKDPTTPPRKRNRAWWLLLFLIPLIAGAIYIFTRDSGTVPPLDNITVTEPPREQAIPPADTVETDTIPAGDAETEPASEEITDSTGFITPDTSKYYLIRGSFEDYENAHKYFLRLKNEGYEPFHLGKHGSFYLVGINIYDNPIEAYGQQYNYLDKYPESGVWIFIPGNGNNQNQ